MSTFSEQLLAFQRKTENKMVRLVYNVVLGVTDNLIELSPWGDWEAWSDKAQRRKPRPPYEPGLFKGAWDYGLGSPSLIEWEVIDATGEVSMSRVRGKVSGLTLRQAAGKHYLSNNTPYAKQMESGYRLVGHNLQLGHMIEATGQRFPTIVTEAAHHVA